MDRKKSEIRYYAITIFTCLMAMTLVVVIALFIYDMIRGEREERDAVDAMAGNNIVYSQQEVDNLLEQTRQEALQEGEAAKEAEILGTLKQSFLDGSTTVGALRPFYPDEIVVVSNGKFYFVPIDDTLEKHNLKQENLLVSEDGEMQYLEEDIVVSHKGIDVSKYQGDIDWEKVKADGVEYAFIRLGIRGYGTGKIVLDEKFTDNIQGANDAGVKVGVYFFTQAVTVEEAIEEAEFVLEQIASYQVDYPVVLDVEKVSESTARMNQITVEERTEIVKAFCDRIQEAGYDTMIYGNMEMFSVLLDFKQLENYDKWYAYYDSYVYFPYDYEVWQYSEKGIVDGIETEVDLNIAFKEW